MKVIDTDKKTGRMARSEDVEIARWVRKNCGEGTVNRFVAFETEPVQQTKRRIVDQPQPRTDRPLHPVYIYKPQVPGDTPRVFHAQIAARIGLVAAMVGILLGSVNYVIGSDSPTHTSVIAQTTIAAH